MPVAAIWRWANEPGDGENTIHRRIRQSSIPMASSLRTPRLQMQTSASSGGAWGWQRLVLNS
jgi:hypothetical protein